MSVGITTHRISPDNVIDTLVKHVDRRLRGCDEKGQFKYSPDFTDKYYYPISSFITRKNSVFKGSVRLDRTMYDNLTHDQDVVIHCFDFGLTLV